MCWHWQASDSDYAQIPWKFKMPTVTFRVGISGAQAAARAKDVCIVVDVLRASSTIMTALHHGYQHIIPVANLTQIPPNQWVAGEADGAKLAGCQFGNSPLEITQQPPVADSLYLHTTNGTGCIQAAATDNESPVFIGALLNQTCIANQASQAAKHHHANISIILAGWHGTLEMDDWVTGSAILADIPSAQITGERMPVGLTDIPQQV
ncbi:MAG: hypothetical protein GKR77_06020, partial [Legionellales bacterium]|nr:hypothetical protein [Legionellales bacterium]